MNDNKGFIELNNVKDYWNKLKHDFNELNKEPNNIYFGFNFFVTSYHLLDWIFIGKYSDDRTKLGKSLILKICSHIANGIKHFETNKKRHNSVKKVEKYRVFEKDVFEDDIFDEPIYIHFEDEYVPFFGKSLKVVDFAKIVMVFWEKELENRKLI